MRQARRGRLEWLGFSTANAGFFGAIVFLAFQSASGAIHFPRTGAEKEDSGLYVIWRRHISNNSPIEGKTMTIEELLYRLVLLYGNPTGKSAKRAALLVKLGAKSEGSQVAGKAIDGPGANLPPVAKILTSLAIELGADEFLGDHCLALNYVPTDWCLGLAWLLKVKYVVYADQGMKMVRTSTNTVGNNGFPPWTQSTWNLSCNYNPHKAKFVFDVDSMNYPKDHQRKEKTAIQATIDSVGAAKIFAEASVRGVRFSRPPAPAFGFLAMPGNAVRDDLFTRAAFALVNKTWKHALGGRPEGLSGHNIGALAVGPDDQILGWAVNVSGVSRCFHAESLLIFQLLDRRINLREMKLRIYCTLEPCHMCAGLITTYCAGAQVFYGMADSNIENSCLARKKSKCEQLLSKTIVNFEETIPQLCAKLRRQFGDDRPITGFLDAPNAARPAFRQPQEQLAVVPNAIRSHEQSIGNTLAALSQSNDLEHRRRMQALLDIRPAKPTVLDESASIKGPILPRFAPQRPELLWIGTNWRAQFPFVQYLDDFLRSIAMKS